MSLIRFSRFERARLIGARALQISMGAPSLLFAEANSDALEIAYSEFASGGSPLNVQRVRDAFD